MLMSCPGICFDLASNQHVYIYRTLYSQMLHVYYYWQQGSLVFRYVYTKHFPCHTLSFLPNVNTLLWLTEKFRMSQWCSLYRLQYLLISSGSLLLLAAAITRTRAYVGYAHETDWHFGISRNAVSILFPCTQGGICSLIHLVVFLYTERAIVRLHRNNTEITRKPHGKNTETPSTRQIKQCFEETHTCQLSVIRTESLPSF